MILGLPRFRRIFICVLIAGIAPALLSCGGSTKTTTPPSGLKFRAFVSQDVSSSTSSPGLIIIDAQLDRLARTGSISAGPSPGLMAVSANRQATLVYSALSNEVDIVDNAKESSSLKLALPGFTESLAISSDATIGFAAVPDAPVAGMAPGAVQVINVGGGALEAPVPNCPTTPPTPVNCLSGARYIVLSPDNTHLLVFGDNPNSMVSVKLTNTGTTASPTWTVESTTEISFPSPQLDHPVWAVFSQDGASAYIMNCGPECGGSTASVTALRLSDNTAVASVSIPGGATYGASFGSTLYVAGSAPGTACPAGTAATSCGTLTVLNTASGLQVVKSVRITDGYHNRMAVTADNQVFVGARGCTAIITSAEQRGCLSIYNGNNGNVVIGTDQGDVTGIQPVTGRSEVYVVENGELRNWSTLTDSLAPSQKQIDILGQAVDVKIVD